MRLWTKAVAWFWLIYSLHILVFAAFGLDPLVKLGLNASVFLGWHNPERRIGTDFIAWIIVAGSIALLAKKVWGWWILILSAGLCALAWIFGAAALALVDVISEVNPIALVALAVPSILSVCLLALDRPAKWQSGSILSQPSEN